MKISKALLLLALAATLLPLPAVAGEGTSQPQVTAFNQFIVERINYANNTATVYVHMEMGVPNGGGSIWVYMTVDRVSYGPIILRAIGSNGTVTSYSNGPNDTVVTIPIQGSPSYFPLDSYDVNFNFTFAAGFYSNATIRNNPQPYMILSQNVQQQFTLFSGSEDWSSTKTGVIGTVNIALARKGWVGWEVLGPLFLIYMMIGFLALLPVERERLYNRMTLQFFIFAILLGFYLTISSSIPASPSFLPLVQILTYAGLSAITVFMLLSVAGRSFGWNEVTTDSIAIAVSVITVDFFLFNLIFSAQLLALTYVEILYLQLGVTLILIAGICLRLFRWVKSNVTELLKTVLIVPLGPPTDSVVNWLYALGFTMNFGALLLTNYVVQILSPNVELIPLRRLLFQYTAGNFFVSGITQFGVSVAIFAVAYFGIRRINRTLWGAFGAIVFLGSLYDFLNDSTLIPSFLGPIGTIGLPVAALVAAWVYSAVYSAKIKQKFAEKFSAKHG